MKPALLRAADIAAGAESGAHPWNPKSEVRGTRLGVATGLVRTGVNLYRIAPGKESFTYHAHYYEEEWIYILSGRAIAEIDGVEHEVGPGDFLGFAADGATAIAHHLRNPFAEELVYLCGGEHRDHEVADFPRQGYRMVKRGKNVELYKISDGKKPFPALDP
ncbi:MAG TPA: cupin domain-containing protein [Polyangia bacterium]|nr:cupin domain-containing protein [Polyangia bacterium]